MTDRELMQQALEALEWWETGFGEEQEPFPIITALRERLAQPKQEPEPVAWFDTPPRREWQGLTEEERVMCRSYDPEEAVAKTEAKLREKNA